MQRYNSRSRGEQSSSTSSKESVADRIVASLRESIRAGRLVPGHRLVEADLTTRFKASRGPVREALRRLVAEGLLSQERNHSIKVRTMSREEVAALFRVRAALEGMAARMAAENIAKPGNRGAIKALFRKMEAALGDNDAERYHDLNEEWHSLVVRSSASTLLIGLIDQLLLQSYRVQFRGVSPSLMKRSHKHHKAISSAIANGDGEAAEAAMRAHIEETALLFQEVPDDYFRRS